MVAAFGKQETEGGCGWLGITLLVSGRVFSNQPQNLRFPKVLSLVTTKNSIEFGVKLATFGSAYTSRGTWCNSICQSVPQFPYLQNGHKYDLLM